MKSKTLVNRLKALENMLFHPAERCFILVGNRDYSVRRLEEGYESFSDLDAVESDIENTKQGLISLGVQ